MKKRNRSILGTLFKNVLVWSAMRLFGRIPVIGPIVRIAAFAFV